MYRKLTTSSTALEFQTFLREMGRTVHQTVDTYAREHRAINQDTKRYGYNGYSNSYPDTEALAVGMSSMMALLWAAADQITEAEDRLEFLGDDDDSEEYQHALGELFGAKSMFLALNKRVPMVERSRIDATQQGKNQQYFLRQICLGEGSTRDENFIDAGLITQGTITAQKIDFGVDRIRLSTTSSDNAISFNKPF